MTGTLTLAALVATMDRPALNLLVTRRRISAPTAVHEPLGLALELLRTDSITRALQAAHRDWLETLLALEAGTPANPEILDALAQLGLVGLAEPGTAQAGSSGTGFVALPEVSAALPHSFLASDPPTELTQVRPADLSGWYAPALTSVRRIAKLLHTIAARPVRLGRKSRPAVVAVRDLAESAHCTPDQAGHLLDVMRASGLLQVHLDQSGAEQLGIAEAATDRWLMQLDYSERWLELAQATIAWFDPRLRRSLAEAEGNLHLLLQRLPRDYPLLPEADLEALTRVAETADELGLAMHGWLTPAAEALLQEDLVTAHALADQDIPGHVAGVYLQPDLSIIVPGPLPPEDEAILNAISETEQLGPAASLRINQDRLTQAVLRAQTGAPEIRAALERLSLTGIPQPLDYLLRDLVRKTSAPLLNVSGSSGSRYATAWEPEETPGVAASWVPSATHTTPIPVKQTGPQPADLQAMIDRVFAAASDAGSEGDLTRRLELAIRDRSPVRVTAVAGKDEREFTLMPVSLKAGRLRATDQKAGVERTLPVSAITAVDTLPA